MTQLKEFMLLFSAEPSTKPPTEEQMNEMHKQWGNFIGNIATKGKLVSTHQLGFTGNKISTDSTVSEGIAVSENKTLTGNMVIVANSLDEATEMAKQCPILNIGGNIEVRSTIPIEN